MQMQTVRQQAAQPKGSQCNKVNVSSELVLSA